MADNKSSSTSSSESSARSGGRNLTDRDDPTIRRVRGAAPEYPEGTHPLRQVSEVTHSAANLEYRDMPEDRKPDPTTVAQEQVLQGTEAGSFGYSDED